jgi:hypothetical protein
MAPEGHGHPGLQLADRRRSFFGKKLEVHAALLIN